MPQMRWVKEYGSVVRTVGPVGLERIMFTKPEALHRILVTEWLDNPRVRPLICLRFLRGINHLPKPAFMRHFLALVTGYGLLTVTGNEHKQMRKAMNPAFSIPNLTARAYHIIHLR